MTLWQPRVSRRSIGILAALAGTVSLAIGAHAALSLRALDAAKAAVASDGFEALRQIDSQAFDLVIMDIAMPGLDGIEVLSRIRSSAQHHELPVIMLTASGDDFVREKAKRVGASAFLTKPASSAEVLATVKSLLN